MISSPVNVSAYILLVLLCGNALAKTEVVQAADDSPWATGLAQLEKEIAIGENAPALAKAVSLLEEVESEYGFYHKYLVEPLVLIGDAYLGLGQAPDALQAYDRAIQSNGCKQVSCPLSNNPLSAKLPRPT